MASARDPNGLNGLKVSISPISNSNSRMTSQQNFNSLIWPKSFNFFSDNYVDCVLRRHCLVQPSSVCPEKCEGEDSKKIPCSDAHVCNKLRF